MTNRLFPFILFLVFLVLAAAGVVSLVRNRQAADNDITFNQPSPTISGGEPTPFFLPTGDDSYEGGSKVLTPTPTATPSETSVKEGTPTTTQTTTAKGGIATTTKKTIICTPVYGMGSTCQEHIVVETGAEDSIAFTFSALSYLGGLAAFIKAKRAK